MKQKKHDAGHRPVRIADVAAAVGVANSTVSRALSRPEMVSFELRERIQSAAADLGYRPNLHARSLILGNSHLVGLMVPDITNPYFGGFIRGGQSEATHRGYRQLVLDTDEMGRVEAAYLDELKGTLSGALLAATKLPPELLQSVSEKLQLVTLNREVEGIPSVVVDAPAAMPSAVDHVMSLGHRSIVYLGAPATSWSDEGRWSALKKAADARGIRCQRLGPFNSSHAEGAAAADAALSTGATACFFFNDMLAIGALQRFEERGIEVPGQISVIGCDDIFGASFCHPPLTTIVAPVEHAGRMAMGMLLDRIEGKASGDDRGRLSAGLKIRRSTGMAPAR